MYTFPKQQRLNSYKRISLLFTNGNPLLLWPLSIRYVVREGHGDVSVVINCPKRYQKLAVNRNRIKRLIRENYRRKSADIRIYAMQKKIDIDLAITYISKEMVSYEQMREKIMEVFSLLKENIIYLQEEHFSKQTLKDEVRNENI